MEVQAPFHARIFRVYINYLMDRLAWPDTKINEMLAELGTSRERIQDDTTWFGQDFSDRFYDAILARTGDSHIAFQAGAHIKKNSLSAIIYYLCRGLIDVGRLYQLIEKMTPYFTKAATLRVVQLKGNSAVLESKPNEGFIERPYMCENRRGTLTGIPQIFDAPLATIVESECLHKGGKKCTYEVRWKSRSEWMWLPRVASLLFLLSVLCFYAFDVRTASALTFVAAVSTLFYFMKQQLKRQEGEAEAQNQVLKKAVDEIERKNQELRLISRIAQLTHSMTSPQDLSNTVVRSVCELLGYDRSILLTVEPQRQILRVSAYFGFDRQMEELLSQAEFNIRADNSSGFFVKVVNTKEPVLMSDVESHLELLSARSQKFAKTLQAKSFVAVPLTDEKKNVIGVLSVDNTKASKVIGVSDQDLMMTLAEHLGIALYNAKMMSQLEENLDSSRLFWRQQKLLRETFQKFVPSDLATDLLSVESADLYRQRISHVRKRAASILFLDIFNFSKIADSMESENVVDLLNEAFGIFEPIVSRYGGFVDKFTGDGLLAIFEDRERSLKACSAASALVHSVSEVNRKLAEKGYPQIEIGIGMNFGSVILGNIGSADRLNFTVIGEAVNLASRLEAFTRLIGPNSICASASIRSRAGDQLSWADLGQVQIKGYAYPIQAFQLRPDGKAAESNPILIDGFKDSKGPV